MKYIVATFGALLVFLVTQVAILFLPTFLIPGLYENMTYVVALYVVGFILGLLAAVASFRGTLRVYTPANEKADRR